MSNAPQQDATKLTPQQESAAEMIASGQRVGNVAQALGIDRCTVWR